MGEYLALVQAERDLREAVKEFLTAYYYAGQESPPWPTKLEQLSGWEAPGE